MHDPYFMSVVDRIPKTYRDKCAAQTLREAVFQPIRAAAFGWLIVIGMLSV